MRASRGFAQQNSGVPSRPLLFVTGRFRDNRYAREVWRRSGALSRRDTWNATLWVPLRGLWQCKRACAAKVWVAVGSRSVFLSGQAAKKNDEHPYAPSRSPSTTALAYTNKYLNASKIRGCWAGRIGGYSLVVPKGGE